MITIREEWIDSIEDYRTDEIVEIFKNPTRKEFLEVAQNSVFGAIRFVAYLKGDIYIWDAVFAHHDVISNSELFMDLERERDIRGTVLIVGGKVVKIDFPVERIPESTLKWVAEYLPGIETAEYDDTLDMETLL